MRLKEIDGVGVRVRTTGALTTDTNQVFLTRGPLSSYNWKKKIAKVVFSKQKKKNIRSASTPFLSTEKTKIKLVFVLFDKHHEYREYRRVYLAPGSPIGTRRDPVVVDIIHVASTPTIFVRTQNFRVKQIRLPSFVFDLTMSIARVPFPSPIVLPFTLTGFRPLIPSPGHPF